MRRSSVREAHAKVKLHRNCDVVVKKLGKPLGGARSDMWRENNEDHIMYIM